MEERFRYNKIRQITEHVQSQESCQGGTFPIGTWRHALLLAEGFGKNFGIPVTTGKSDRFDGEIRIR